MSTRGTATRRGGASDTGAGPREVECPRCGAATVYAPANRWRPFCSERCRSLDLGAWASERFRVTASEPADGGDEAPPQ